MLTVHNYRHAFAMWNVLHSIADQRLTQTYLEVGVCRGLSLEVMLNANFPPQRLILCDSWGGESGGESFGGPAHIERLLDIWQYPRTAVQFLNGNSHTLLKTITTPCDLILVDGDHTVAGAQQDLEDCWPLLTPDGLLVFDDLIHPSHPYLLDVFRAFASTVQATVVYEDTVRPMGVGVLCKTS